MAHDFRITVRVLPPKLLTSVRRLLLPLLPLLPLLLVFLQLIVLLSILLPIVVVFGMSFGFVI
jgi:hypothetical protein